MDINKQESIKNVISDIIFGWDYEIEDLIEIFKKKMGNICDFLDELKQEYINKNIKILQKRDDFDITMSQNRKEISFETKILYISLQLNHYVEFNRKNYEKEHNILFNKKPNKKLIRKITNEIINCMRNKIKIVDIYDVIKLLRHKKRGINFLTKNKVSLELTKKSKKIYEIIEKDIKIPEKIYFLLDIITKKTDESYVKLLEDDGYTHINMSFIKRITPKLKNIKKMFNSFNISIFYEKNLHRIDKKELKYLIKNNILVVSEATVIHLAQLYPKLMPMLHDYVSIKTDEHVNKTKILKYLQQNNTKYSQDFIIKVLLKNKKQNDDFFDNKENEIGYSIPNSNDMSYPNPDMDLMMTFNLWDVTDNTPNDDNDFESNFEGKLFVKQHKSGWRIVGYPTRYFVTWVSPIVAYHTKYGYIYTSEYRYDYGNDGFLWSSCKNDEGIKHFLRHHPPLIWDSWYFIFD